MRIAERDAESPIHRYPSPAPGRPILAEVLQGIRSDIDYPESELQFDPITPA